MLKHLIIKPADALQMKVYRRERYSLHREQQSFQNLAVTYNKVYLENQETQKLDPPSGRT